MTAISESPSPDAVLHASPNAVLDFLVSKLSMPFNEGASSSDKIGNPLVMWVSDQDSKASDRGAIPCRSPELMCQAEVDHHVSGIRVGGGEVPAADDRGVSKFPPAEPGALDLESKLHASAFKPSIDAIPLRALGGSPFEARRWTGGVDPRICQTFAACPA